MIDFNDNFGMQLIFMFIRLISTFNELTLTSAFLVL